MGTGLREYLYALQQCACLGVESLRGQRELSCHSLHLVETETCEGEGGNQQSQQHHGQRGDLKWSRESRMQQSGDTREVNLPGHREDAHVRHAKDKNRIPGMFCMHNATWTMHVQGLVMVRKRWRTCMHVRQGAGTAESGAAGLCIPNRSYHRSCLFSFGRMVELF